MQPKQRDVDPPAPPRAADTTAPCVAGRRPRRAPLFHTQLLPLPRRRRPTAGLLFSQARRSRRRRLRRTIFPRSRRSLGRCRRRSNRPDRCGVGSSGCSAMVGWGHPGTGDRVRARSRPQHEVDVGHRRSAGGGDPRRPARDRAAEIEAACIHAPLARRDMFAAADSDDRRRMRRPEDRRRQRKSTRRLSRALRRIGRHRGHTATRRCSEMNLCGSFIAQVTGFGRSRRLETDPAGNVGYGNAVKNTSNTARRRSRLRRSISACPTNAYLLPLRSTRRLSR